MSEASRKLEVQIQRIHRLIEDTGADVVWNDRIADPDNPAQSRQIDVAIRRDGKLTIVECRTHNSPQDVTWIEELIGRRSSLKADAIVAVSASGFTSGAKLKAARFGIVLRQLDEISADDVDSWGLDATLVIIFYELVGLALVIKHEGFDLPKDAIVRNTKGGEINFLAILDLIVKNIEDNDPKDGDQGERYAKFQEAVVVGDTLVDEAAFFVKLARHSIRGRTVSGALYADPNTKQEMAKAAKFNVTNFETIFANGNIGFVSDIGDLRLPPNCFISSIGQFYSKPPLLAKGKQLRHFGPAEVPERPNLDGQIRVIFDPNLSVD